jgi:hypothetical protein
LKFDDASHFRQIDQFITQKLHLPPNEMLLALRADHWLHLHPEAPEALKQSIKAQIFQAFYTDTDVWREQIITQAREAMQQALQALS